jgi:hypothetical protein
LATAVAFTQTSSLVRPVKGVLVHGSYAILQDVKQDPVALKETFLFATHHMMDKMVNVTASMRDMHVLKQMGLKQLDFFPISLLPTSENHTVTVEVGRMFRNALFNRRVHSWFDEDLDLSARRLRTPGAITPVVGDIDKANTVIVFLHGQNESNANPFDRVSQFCDALGLNSTVAFVMPVAPLDDLTGQKLCFLSWFPFSLLLSCFFVFCSISSLVSSDTSTNTKNGNVREQPSNGGQSD